MKTLADKVAEEDEEGRPSREDDPRICPGCLRHPVETWARPPYLLAYCQGCFPYESWELMELVLKGCPDEALKVFRKTLIGKGNPLKASQADAAIAGARCVIATGPVVKRGKRAMTPEKPEANYGRLLWYLSKGLPVVFARPANYEWTDDELQLIEAARDLEAEVTFLEFTDDAVDRVAGP